MTQELTQVQKEILRVLFDKKSSYANPVSSQTISKLLNLNPSYVREQAKILFGLKLINVRRGPKGGYFVIHNREERKMAETEQLLLEALESGREYLPKLYAGLKEVAELLQEGREGEGIKLFQDALDGIEWVGTVTEALLTITLTGRSQLLAADWRQKAEDLKKVFHELNEAWANRDYVLIADLIEYELLPYLDLLYQQITNLLGSQG